MIFALYIFAKSFQTDGLMQAILNIAFIVTLFAVGWTVIDMLVGFVISDYGYILHLRAGSPFDEILRLTGAYFPQGENAVRIAPKDVTSLLLLSTAEAFFYKFFFSVTKSPKHQAS
jgi:divalent metal cation (Fe/Co/Zn/Cd) transporter